MRAWGRACNVVGGARDSGVCGYVRAQRRRRACAAASRRGAKSATRATCRAPGAAARTWTRPARLPGAMSYPRHARRPRSGAAGRLGTFAEVNLEYIVSRQASCMLAVISQQRHGCLAMTPLKIFGMTPLHSQFPFTHSGPYSVLALPTCHRFGAAFGISRLLWCGLGSVLCWARMLGGLIKHV
jgi:hypothetical protein